MMRAPETPHEKWFQTTYEEALKRAVVELQAPLNIDNLDSACSSLKEVLLNTLNQLKDFDLI
jgi:hypothetical protein